MTDVIYKKKNKAEYSSWRSILHKTKPLQPFCWMENRTNWLVDFVFAYTFIQSELFFQFSVKSLFLTSICRTPAISKSQTHCISSTGFFLNESISATVYRKFWLIGIMKISPINCKYWYQYLSAASPLQNSFCKVKFCCI